MSVFLKPSEILVRQATASDSSAIREINEAAFKRKDEADLVEAITASRHFVPELSLVAEYQFTKAGYVLFSKVNLENSQADNILALAPVSVMPEYQRNGVGSKLIKFGITRSNELGFPLITVLGDPGYYSRFNFVLATKYNITCPFPNCEEHYMVMPMDTYTPDLKGKIIYPPAFHQ